MKSYPRALTIAGSDSGGGAGIQADLKTFSARRVYGASVLTALTAQNTIGVLSIHEVPVNFIADQLDAVLSDIGADAVKIGMLFSPEIIRFVADKLEKSRVTRIILDPVMVAKSGDHLLQEEAVDVLRSTLWPLAEIATPNLPEAELLLGRPLRSEIEMEEAARELASWGPKAVLLKGGHREGATASDTLVLRGAKGFEIHWLKADRINTKNSHGTGCTLSAAICAERAKDQDIVTAVGNAKNYLTAALREGSQYTLGRGQGPVCHFVAT